MSSETTEKYIPKTVTLLLKVQSIRFITDNTFVLRFERGNLDIKAGQYITVGIKGELQRREYSVYSPENADYIEILVREVIDGNVSVQLRNCREGQYVEVQGPFGFEKVDPKQIKNQKYIFIASGTGIAPFHSCVASFKGLNYMVLHGVRFSSEAYDRGHYDKDKYVLCTSGDALGDFHGRVTGFLKGFNVDKDMVFHISGNSKMIFEAYEILVKKGVCKEKIHLEVYF